MIAADKDVRYEAVLKVMDMLQQNQVKQVGLLARPRALGAAVNGATAPRRHPASRVRSSCWHWRCTLVFFALLVFGIAGRSSADAAGEVGALGQAACPAGRRPAEGRREPEPSSPSRPRSRRNRTPAPEPRTGAQTPPKAEPKPEPPKPDPEIAERKEREKEGAREEGAGRQKKQKRDEAGTPRKGEARKQRRCARKREADEADKKKREARRRPRQAKATADAQAKAAAEAATPVRLNEIDRYRGRIRAKIRGKANVPDTVRGRRRCRSDHDPAGRRRARHR